MSGEVTETEGWRIGRLSVFAIVGAALGFGLSMLYTYFGST